MGNGAPHFSAGRPLPPFSRQKSANHWRHFTTSGELSDECMHGRSGHFAAPCAAIAIATNVARIVPRMIVIFQ
jgi:hypothetical protein